MASESVPSSGLPPIRACLFDMDGLLINSEDIYTLCINHVLHEYGKPDLPWSIKRRLQGRPGPESGRLFQEWAQLPISEEEIRAKVQVLQTQHFPNTKPLPGVEALLENLKGAVTQGQNGRGVEIALATSSHKLNFKLKTDHQQQLFSVFEPEHTVLGDDERIAPGRGKPAPDIYLLALQCINDTLKAKGEPEIHPEECLVFEDSVPGVEAGRRAGMQVVWCPHEGLLREYRGREGEVLAGLTGEHKDDQEENPKWQQLRDEWIASGRPLARVRGRTGDLDDGWARFYSSLVDFPFSDWGIDTAQTKL